LVGTDELRMATKGIVGWFRVRRFGMMKFGIDHEIVEMSKNDVCLFKNNIIFTAQASLNVLKLCYSFSKFICLLEIETPDQYA